MPTPQRSILIALGQDDGQERAILASLYSQILRRPGWRAFILDPAILTMERVAAQPLDAVVGRIEPALADRIAAKLPTVSTLPGRFGRAYSVVTDDEAIGRTAAEYFLDRGFTEFAYVGSGRVVSQQRHSAFCARLARNGAKARTYLGPDTGATSWNPSAVDRELTTWVRDLPSPTAVLAESDLVGFRVSEICRHFKISIPDHLSLVGVGNDDLMCRLCHPPLTTIAAPSTQIGVMIAETLDALLNNARPNERVTKLPHTGIIERQSANIVRTDDAEVAHALRFIRENAQKAISIEDIVTAVLTSRRTLERRFRRVIGMSLQEAITESRVERAKSLLAYSRSPLGEIAQLCGFNSTQRFHIVFRRAAGTTPQAYRHRFQAAGLEKAAAV